MPDETIDVQALIDNARPNQEVVPVRDGVKAVLVYRDDMHFHEIDLEEVAERPARTRGTIKVSTAGGFVTAVTDRKGTDVENHPVLYRDDGASALVAVLNDAGPDGPGWRDHRVALNLQRTTEWKFWVENQGLKSQEDFARIIQLGEQELVSPTPALMLEIAQSFQARTDANVKSAKRLRDGRIQMVYEENISAAAGEGGTLEIPEIIELTMRPFYGSVLFEVRARLEWRIQQGKLTIGYTLLRPADVERSAFAVLADAVSEALVDVAIAVDGSPG